MQSTPIGEYKVHGPYNYTAKINNNLGRVVLNGRINDVNKTLASMEFKPACILDSSNFMEINITFTQKRLLQESEIEYGTPKRYRINMNVNSGVKRTYRGKFVEENL